VAPDVTALRSVGKSSQYSGIWERFLALNRVSGDYSMGHLA
jgi:hypothetical protein